MYTLYYKAPQWANHKPICEVPFGGRAFICQHKTRVSATWERDRLIGLVGANKNDFYICPGECPSAQIILGEGSRQYTKSAVFGEVRGESNGI